MAQYATIADADAYFATRLYTDAWDDTDNTDKDKALMMATRIIDRLNFAGFKSAVQLAIDNGSDLETADSSQELQFPRGSDTEIPNDIKLATYEIAFQLLDGFDPEQEARRLGQVSQGYSSVRTTYDRQFIQEYLNAGVPSAVAWNYLKPFLRDRGSVSIKRVS